MQNFIFCAVWPLKPDTFVTKSLLATILEFLDANLCPASGAQKARAKPGVSFILFSIQLHIFTHIGFYMLVPSY